MSDRNLPPGAKRTNRAGPVPDAQIVGGPTPAAPQPDPGPATAPDPVPYAAAAAEAAPAAAATPGPLPHVAATPASLRTSTDAAARNARTATALGALALAGVVLTAGGLAYVWAHPSNELAQDTGRLQALDGEVQAAKQQRDTLAGQLDALKPRLAELEARKPADLAPLDQRLGALEKSAVGAGAQDLTELSRRIDALATREDQLGARQQADMDSVNGRTDAAITQARSGAVAALAGLEHQIAADQDADKSARDALATALGGRIDAGSAALSGRIDAATAADQAARQTLASDLGTKQDAAAAAAAKQLGIAAAAQQTNLATASARLAAIETRLGIVEQSSGKVAGLAARAGRMAQLQSAQVDLAAGHSLGTLPDAPPALARYANAPPPTEAALKLGFADAAEAARQASQPQSADRPFLGRIWARVQQGVVVRQGDSVVVGDPASGVLARAQDALDAGDLAGTVQVVRTLQGPAKDAMADWLAQAQSLLDARAALAQLVAHA